MTPSMHTETQLDPALAGLSAGTLVGGGRFVLLHLLGQGGMGVVWLARDEHLREEVALKFLPPEIRHDAAALDDLRRETSRSRKLTNPSILRIHDLYKGEQEAFISMEYVEGPNLTERRLDQPDRVLKWSYLEPLVKQLCEALSYAHGENIVHRDLKPANLMLDGRGRLKLADFGIAATVSDSISRVSRARHGLSGTASYMSPQQLDGQLPQVTDDIYSVGSTLYELLTSRAPFFTGDIPHQVRSLPPQPIEKRLAQLRIDNPVPPAVSDAIMACLSKDPEKRPQSAADLARQLGLQTSSVAAPTSARPGESGKQQSKQSPATSHAALSPSLPEASPLANPRAAAETAPVPPETGPSVVDAKNASSSARIPALSGPANSPASDGDTTAHGSNRARAWGALATVAILIALIIVAASRPRVANPDAAKNAAPAPTAAAPEFISIFNGRDFSDWDGNPQFWSVKDGAITANAGTSKDRKPVAVFWRGGTVEDFELRLSFRIESGNSGIYYRAKQLPANEVGGYQFEIAGDKTGVLLETGSDRMRREPSRRGATVSANVIDGKEKVTVDGRTKSTALEVRDAFHRDGWNDVVIIVQGNHVIHQLNGHTMIETTDNYDQRPTTGRVALEVYGRDPTTVQFRDIRLKRLPSPASNNADQQR